MKKTLLLLLLLLSLSTLASAQILQSPSGTGMGPGFAPMQRVTGVAPSGPVQDTSFAFEFKSASTRYVDPGIGEIAYWDAPNQTLRASQSYELYKPTLSGQSLVFAGSRSNPGKLTVALPASTSRNIAVICRATLNTNPSDDGGVLWVTGIDRSTAAPYPYCSLFTFANSAELGNWGNYQTFFNPSNFTATKTWIMNSDNASGTIYDGGTAVGNLAWVADKSIPESWRWSVGPSYPNGFSVVYFAVVNRTLKSSEIATFTSNLATEYP